MSGEQVFHRPASLQIPVVWSRFRGLKPMPDGRVPDFWVQCVRPEDDDAVFAIMEQHFLREEETSRVLRLLDEPDTLAEVRTWWRGKLDERVSLAAWTTWPDGKPTLIACNILYVAFQTEPKVEGNTPVSRLLLRSLYALMDKADPFTLYSCDRYLSAIGLSVLPTFRGQGLGMELLRARVPLCRALGLGVTATIFTGGAAQKQAQRAGFTRLAQLRYADYEDEGRRIYEDVKNVEFMEFLGMVISPEEDSSKK